MSWCAVDCEPRARQHDWRPPGRCRVPLQPAHADLYCLCGLVGCVALEVAA